MHAQSSMGIRTKAWPGINFNKVQFFPTNVSDEPDRLQVLINAVTGDVGFVRKNSCPVTRLTAFRDSRPSYLLATTGRARAWSGDVRSTYAESVDADERAISECNQRCERANRAGDHTVDHCRRAMIRESWLNSVIRGFMQVVRRWPKAWRATGVRNCCLYCSRK